MSPNCLHELPTEVLRLHLSNKWLVTIGHRNQLVHEYLRANTGSDFSESSAHCSNSGSSEPEVSASDAEGHTSGDGEAGSDDERDSGPGEKIFWTHFRLSLWREVFLCMRSVKRRGNV